MCFVQCSRIGARESFGGFLLAETWVRIEISGKEEKDRHTFAIVCWPSVVNWLVAVAVGCKGVLG